MALIDQSLTAWVEVPATFSSRSYLGNIQNYIDIVLYAFVEPGSFFSQCANKVAKDFANISVTQITPYVKKIFTETPQQLFFSTFQAFFAFLQNPLSPLFFKAFEISKYALQIMVSDLFEAFVMPLSEQVSKGVSLQAGLTLGMLGITFLTHEISIKQLKEDPKIADSITYGALTGTFTSFMMDHDICMGTLAGAVTGLITDTALNIFTYNSLSIFFKNQYKNFKIEERAQKTQKIASQVFPYLFFTLGTSFVYSQIKPMLLKILEGEEISSQKLYTLKAIALSGFLFGTIKSYSLPTLHLVWSHIKEGLQTAQDIEKTFSWAPRILTILYITSILNKNILIKN